MGYMNEKGIAAERMTAEGLGDTQPLASNATPAGREANRRVELLFHMPEGMKFSEQTLKVQTELSYSGELTLKNVRYNAAVPEGFTFKSARCDFKGTSVSPSALSKQEVAWNMGDWLSETQIKMEYDFIPLDHRSIRSNTRLNAVLEYDMPNGRTEQTRTITNTVPTRVEEVLFRINLEGALFDVGSSTLKPAALRALEKMGEFLIWQDRLRISVEGFTDSTGTYENNKLLSLKRAGAVKEYLTKNYAIGPERILTAGYGEDFPVADNRTAAGRALNRRVEVIVNSEFVQKINAGESVPVDSLRQRIENNETHDKSKSVRNKRS